MTTNEKAVLVLEELRRKVEFQSAGFSFWGADKTSELFQELVNSQRHPKDATSFIKEATRLYMESWVLPHIEALIALHKGDVKQINEAVRYL